MLAELEERAKSQHVSPMSFVWVLRALGERELAREKLAQAFSQRALILQNWAMLKQLRDEPIVKAFDRHLKAADGTRFRFPT